MGQLWVKSPDGTWDPGLPAIRTATGWVNGRLVYEKTTATVWSLRWSRDTTPPGVPASVTLTHNATTGKISIVAKAPSTTDVRMLRIKVSTTAYSNTTAVDGSYWSTGMSDGSKWSDPLVSPNGTVTRSYPPTATKVTAGRTYYVSVWAQDTSYNWSPVRQAALKVPVPVVPKPGTITRSAYVLPVDSGTYGDQTHWRKDNNYVYQAGPEDWRGAYFYGTRISSILAKAKKVTKMTVYLGRLNSSHGVADAADIKIARHLFATQPSGSPDSAFGDAYFAGTLNRGQYKTFTLPADWYEQFRVNWNKGVGLRSDQGGTSYTNDDYVILYGAGTQSGKLYIEWQE